MTLSQPRQPRSTWWRSRWFQVGLLALLIIVLRFWPMLFEAKTMYFADNYSLIVPGKMFTASWLKQGILPLWNPYLMAGLPWLADINQSVWYPSTLLFWALPTSTAVNLTIMSHLVLTFIGMYLLSWRWTKHHPASLIVAGLWATSTQVSGSSNNLTTLQAIVWLPWLAWLGLDMGRDRKTPWLMTAIIWLQLAAGYPQHVVYGIATAGAVSAYTWWIGLPKTTKPVGRGRWWLAWSAWVKAWLLTGILTLGTTAIIWIPFLEALLQSTRMVQTNQQAAVGSLHPAMLIKLISPYFFDKASAGMKWGPAWSGQPNVVLYLTWVGLAAIATVVWQSKRRIKDDWFLGLASAVTLVLALGSYLPGYELLQQVVPFFRVARYPSITLMITNLLALIWLATALKRFSVSDTWFKVGLGLLGVTAIGCVVLLTRSATEFNQFWDGLDGTLGHRLSAGQFHTPARDFVIFQVILESAVVSLVLTLAALWGLAKKRWWLVVLAMCVDMIYHTQGMYFFGPKAVYSDQLNSPITQQLSPDPQSRWLTRNSNHPYTDFGSYWEAMVVRAPFSDSFVDAAELDTAQHATRLRQGLTPDWQMLERVPLIHGYTCLLPQSYADLWENNGVTGINFIDQIEPSAALLSQWAVRYYVVDTWFKVDEPIPGKLLQTIGQWQVYELPALSRFRYSNDQPVVLENLVENPNQIELTFTNSTTEPYLIVADRYDRNWQAWVNDQPVQIENWQEMRQVPITAGTNQVKLIYRPLTLWWGAVISLLSLLGGGAYYWFFQRQSAN